MKEELPLAPYNVKLFCRAGPQNATSRTSECPSSATACGYFEFETKDPAVPSGKIEVHECVDNGVLLKESEEYEDDINSQSLFEDLCGAVPRCSVLHLRALNTNFLKYIIVAHNIKLKQIAKPTVKFCCALYHSTLNRLVTSGRDVLPSIAAPPLRCGQEQCGAGAIGCLIHSRYGRKSEFEGRPAKVDGRTPPKGAPNQEEEEEGEYIEEAAQSSDEYEDQIKAVEFSFGDDEDTYLKGMDVIEYEDVPSETGDGATTKKEIVLLRSGGPGPRTSDPEPYVSIEKEYEDGFEEGEQVCVYRHLNDEQYRYCLLIHSEKDGDRCYEHRGHSVCCCFVAPDQTTCDPHDLDLVVPAPALKPKKKLLTTATPPITHQPDQGLGDVPSDDDNRVKIDLDVTTTVTSQIPGTTLSSDITTTHITSVGKPAKKRKGRPRITATAKPSPNVRQGCRLVYVGSRWKDGGQLTPRLECSATMKNLLNSLVIFIAVCHVWWKA
ncbi:unnamed protein product, partial [Mesorhabditis spiculigera]